MTTPPIRRYPPTEKEKSELDDLQAKLNDDVYKSLSVWRAGFAAILVVASGGLTVSSLDQMAKSTEVWRWLLAACVVLGTVLGVIALMVTLRAEVGTARSVKERADILDRGGVLVFETGLADAAARRMHRSQRWGIASLALLLAALACLWLAPRGGEQPMLQVQQGAETTCGQLLSADGGTIRLKIQGAHDPVAIPFQGIDNMRVVSSCPAG